VDVINSERRLQIVTIEDPIEFVHENKRAIVVQQEVLTDVRSFNRALIHVCGRTRTSLWSARCASRGDCTALTAAETGHLVLATIIAKCFTRAGAHRGVFDGNSQRQIILHWQFAARDHRAGFVAGADRTRRCLLMTAHRDQRRYAT